jgi:hypothetical protein
MTEERPPESTSMPDEATADPPPDAEPVESNAPGVTPPSETPAVAPPAYTPPTSTPPSAAPQPAVAWSPPPAEMVATGQRTMLSLAAGILLLILGILGVLFGLLIALVGGTFVRNFDFGNMPGFNGGNPGEIVGSVVTFVGIVLLVGGIIYLIGGIGVIRSRDWGRIVGILVGILGGLFWLLGVVGGGLVG